MKKCIFLFALSLCTITLFAQESRESSTRSSLSPVEIQLSPGGWIPDLGINFYLKQNTLLRFDAINTNRYFDDSEDQYLTKRRVGAFLEFRRYKDQSKVFYSHGPSVGYQFSTGENVFKGQELQIGYNLGFGYRITKHVTGGTYLSPYVGINESGVDFLHGRLFVGALSNIYLAYRF